MGVLIIICVSIISLICGFTLGAGREERTALQPTGYGNQLEKSTKMNSIILQKLAIIITMIIVGIYCIVCSVVHIENSLTQPPVFLFGLASFLRAVYLLKNG